MYAEHENLIQIDSQTKMNTDQIEQLCRTDQEMQQKFGGVFYKDNIPNLAEDYKFYVCNTDPSSEPGDYWVGLHAAGGMFNIYIRLVL